MRTPSALDAPKRFRRCPRTSIAMDASAPYECRCTLARGHDGDCICEHGFRQPPPPKPAPRRRILR